MNEMKSTTSFRLGKKVRTRSADQDLVQKTVDFEHTCENIAIPCTIQREQVLRCKKISSLINN
jgi:hypothetical protein